MDFQTVASCFLQDSLTSFAAMMPLPFYAPEGHRNWHSHVCLSALVILTRGSKYPHVYLKTKRCGILTSG